MSDDEQANTADTEGDTEPEGHHVPAELTRMYEQQDYAERAALGPHQP